MKQRIGKRILPVLTCLLVLAGMCCPVAFGAISYSTNSYHVDVVVGENNRLAVTETIDVDFLTPAHGIYRYIPEGGNLYYVENGVTVSRPINMKLKSLDVKGDSYDAEKTDGVLVVRIGDADVTLTGPKTYEISYNSVWYDDGIETYDQLYWNILPQNWETPIGNASFSITMPKEFDESAVDVIVGKTGSGDSERAVWTKDGLTISGYVPSGLDDWEGVTVLIKLPQGYFVNQASDTWKAWLFGGVLAFLAAAAFYMFLRFGRDRKIIPVVEFYPPNDMTPAEVGYAMDEKADNKDIIALILYLADKGYMTIKRMEPERKFLVLKEKLLLTKVKDLPEGSPSYLSRFFNALWETGASVYADELPEEFGEAFSDTRSLLASYFDDTKRRNVYDKSSKLAKGGGLMLSVAILFIMMFAWASSIWSPALSKGFMLFGLACLLIAIVSTLFMKRRSDENVELMGRILGFKEFIKAAEVDRIKTLVDENPTYFYDILPYAYVFDLTDKWVKNFEGIPTEVPSWYASYDGSLFSWYVFSNAFQSSVESSIPTSFSTDDGSSFGGGGSFGGGFSGGGGGGGGGGAW